MTNDSACYTFKNREVTLDLAGKTLTLSDTNNNNMFTVGAGGSLTVKNGVIDALRNGRIPEGETAIVRRRVFIVENNASDAKLVAEGLTINASKMLAVIGNGEASFIDCDIDFRNDYENMIDLYSNGNAAEPTVLNLVRCDMKGYKTVINSYKPGDVSGYYSEINATSCNIETNERVFSTEAVSKITLNGGYYKGKYILAKESYNPDVQIFIYRQTYFSLDPMAEKPDAFYITDGKCVRCDNKDYPYVVSDRFYAVDWDILGSRARELWAEGSVPECPIDIPENTAAVRYVMNEPKPIDRYESFTLRAELNFTPKITFGVGYGFTMNLYVPEADYASVKIGNSPLFYKMQF